jgi:hypothetical protein
MYLCITVNNNKFVLASSVKAFTDEANKFTDNANKHLFSLRTTYIDFITEFALLPSTGNGLYIRMEITNIFFMTSVTLWINPGTLLTIS